MEESGVTEELYERIIKEFRYAYPDISKDESDHIARNFIQVITGILSVGEKCDNGKKPSQMDIANSTVYWCVANTTLEDYLNDDEDAETGDPSKGIAPDEMDDMTKEFVARISDWLIGLKVLQEDPDLFRVFISGALAFGASKWEKSRGALGH